VAVSMWMPTLTSRCYAVAGQQPSRQPLHSDTCQTYVSCLQKPPMTTGLSMPTCSNSKTPTLRAGLVAEICRSASPALLSSVVMVLAHLANSQEHLTELRESAFKNLAKVPATPIC